MYVPDNEDFLRMHEAEQARILSRLPKCACCGEPIQSEYAYEVDGLYCEDCFEEWKDSIRVSVDDLED